jgi:hypothetical protein
MVFLTIAGNTSFTKVAQEGKTTHIHRRNTNLLNQILSQVERGKYPLLVYKISSSRNYCCASLNFLSWFVAPKYDVIAHPNGADRFFPDYRL